MGWSAGRVVVVMVVGATLAAFGGCAAARRPARVEAPAGRLAAALGPGDLALDDIPGRPDLKALAAAATLPATMPATGPAQAPLEALVLYGRARSALADKEWEQAIDLLGRAVALDPDSFDLHYALGKALREARGGGDERSLAEFERAAALRPDDLDVQADLGRQRLSRGDADEGLRRLRLARQTSEYQADAPRALEVDLFLAHALAGLGYDQAAIALFEQVLGRLSRGGAERGSEAAYAVMGGLYQQLGDLYLKRGRLNDALVAYESAEGDAADFALQSRLVHLLLALGRPGEAATRAAQAVSAFRASPEAVALLRQVYRAVGRESDAAAELAQLHARRPDDRAILFALADVLRTEGRWRDADSALAQAADAAPGDAEILARRFALLESADRQASAARVLIEAIARRPALVEQLDETIQRLAKPENRRRLGLDQLASLAVAPDAAPAKAYVLARVAEAWPRRRIAERALTSAIAARPVFSPAFRRTLDQIWKDPALSPQARDEQSEMLAAAAANAGDLPLAAELRGQADLRRGDVPGARAHFANALRGAGVEPSADDPTADHTAESPPRSPRTGSQLPGAVSPATLLGDAQSRLAAGDERGFELIVWKLIDSYPMFGPASAALHDYYWRHDAIDSAEKVAAAWARTAPLAIAPRLLLVRGAVRQGRLDAAMTQLDALFEQADDDPRVLDAQRELYDRLGRLDALLNRWDDRLSSRPDHFHLATQLAEQYLAHHRLDDAARTLNLTRAAAAAEPDVLSHLARLYSALGQPQTAADALQQAHNVQPSPAPPSDVP